MIAVVLLPGRPCGRCPHRAPRGPPERDRPARGRAPRRSHRRDAPLTAAGAAHDPPTAPGLANLTGTLLTRGTAKRTGPEMDAAIEFVGGASRRSPAATVSPCRLSVLSKDLALGLDLLADVVLSPTFPEAELSARWLEIQAAIKRSEEDPGTVASRALARLVYAGHPYAMPVEGTQESVARLTRDDVVTVLPHERAAGHRGHRRGRRRRPPTRCDGRSLRAASAAGPGPRARAHAVPWRSPGGHPARRPSRRI